MFDLEGLSTEPYLVDCAVGAVLTGGACYYFIPAAANSTTAVQIAGATFLSCIVGRWISRMYIRPMLYPFQPLVPPQRR